jgi:putative membrane protein
VIVRRTLSWRRVVGYVGWPIAVHVLVATAIAVLHGIGRLDWLALPSLPVTILAATIGILLAFRNNSAYDRWWEARTVWGGIVNQSRTFARQVLTFFPAALPLDGGVLGTAGHSDGDVNGERRARLAPLAPVVASRVAASAVDSAARAWEAGDRQVAYGSDGAVRDPNGRAAPANGAGEARVTAVAPRVVYTPYRVAAAPDPGEPTERCAFDAVTAEARELVYAQVGFVHALRCHLRRQDPFPEVTPFFRPGLIAALREEQNVPAAILVWMATRLRRLLDGRRADDVYRLVALDGTLGELTNLLGACERIKNTPIPGQYDWLPRVVTRAYLLFLPLALVAELGLATPLVTAVIAFLFLSMDAIGRNVEAPFENDIHDTPMTALSRTIEINLRQMLGDTELPPAVQPVDGFLY